MKIRIGTRGSELAKKQTELVCAALKNIDSSLEFEVKEITTTGDKHQSLEKKVSDKKEWIYELEQSLLRNDIDIAVHSGKDIPNNIEDGTEILPVLKRATPNDCFIGKVDPVSGKRKVFKELPAGSVVATSSLRRKAALKLSRPDLKIIDMRGNVPTRLRKLDESTDISGIVLAAAGIERLNLNVETQYFSFEEMIPAMNQGILAVQYLKNSPLKEELEKIGDKRLQIVFNRERECALKLNADCNSSIGIYAFFEKAEVLLLFKDYSVHTE